MDANSLSSSSSCQKTESTIQNSSEYFSKTTNIDIITQVFNKKEISSTISGAACLVAKSQFQVEHVGHLIPKDEVDTQITIACLVKGISQPMRLLLSEALLKTEKMAKKQAIEEYLRNQNNTTKNPWSTCIPSTPSSMRTLLLEGKHALIPNLPIPKIEVINDHAYI